MLVFHETLILHHSLRELLARPQTDLTVHHIPLLLRRRRNKYQGLLLNKKNKWLNTTLIFFADYVPSKPSYFTSKLRAKIYQNHTKFS